MSGQVGHTADRVALNLDVGAEHLTDEGLETAERHDEKLVLSWGLAGEDGGCAHH